MKRALRRARAYRNARPQQGDGVHSNGYVLAGSVPKSYLDQPIARSWRPRGGRFQGRCRSSRRRCRCRQLDPRGSTCLNTCGPSGGWRAGLYAGFCTGLAPGGGHPSRPAVARRLQRPTRGTCGRAARPSAWPCSGWGLPSRPGHPGRWCALTAPFHPCLCRSGGAAIGGLFSVALSCGSPRLGVTQHPALWSPDVPRTGRSPYAAARPARHQAQR